MADTTTPIVEKEGASAVPVVAFAVPAVAATVPTVPAVAATVPVVASVTTVPVDALNLLAQGKRNIVCGEVQNAVVHLQEACRLLAVQYGETADECADAYYTYGSALLELSRMESGVLGNALQGIESDEEEEEDEEKSSSSGDDKIDESEKMTEEQKEVLSEEIIDAMMEREEEVAERLKKQAAATAKTQENGDASEPTGDSAADGKATESKDAEVDDSGAEKMDTATEGAEKPVEGKAGEEESADDKEAAGDTEEGESEDIEDEEKEGEEEGGEKKEDAEGEAKKEGEEGEKKEPDEDDVSNLQLAWEMLELAKVIYQRQETSQMKLKCAESHLRLGEVGLETEQYEQAIADFEACLALQKALLSPDDRLLAETYYQLGLACTFDKRYEPAIDNYRHAIKAIQAKLAHLKDILEEGKKQGKGEDLVDFDDPVYKARREVVELEEILPDIMGKLEDVEDEKKNAEKVKSILTDSTAPFGSAAEAKTETNGTQKASDITHLVRKKRKPEEDFPKEDAEAEKKARTEEHGAGDASTVNGGKTNGKTTASSPEKGMEVDAADVKTKTVEDVTKAAVATEAATPSSS